MWTPLKTVFGADLRSLAALRVMLALYLLFDIANRWPYLNVFYTDGGLLSRAEAIVHNHPGRWSFLLANGDPWFAHLVFGLLTLSAFALLLGYRTRLATVLCWVLTISITNRNLFVLQGGDDLSCALLFWAMFLPLGARFSVDDALRQEHAQPVSQRQPRSHAYISPASVAILLQVSYVYVFGAFLKDGAEWHSELSAVYFALSAESVSSSLGEHLLGFKALLAPLTAYVFWLELLMPLYVFTPIFFTFFRTTGLILLIALHLGFAVFLSVGLFPLISIASLSVLIPPAAWAWLERKTGRGVWALYYDEGCTFCQKTCLILRSFCLPYDTPIQPAQQDAIAGPILERETSWVVAHPDGRLLTHWDGVVAVLKNSPLTWPFGAIAGLLPKAMGRKLYVRVGNSRGCLGTVTATLLPFRARSESLNGSWYAFVSACALLVLLRNLHHEEDAGLKMPPATEYVAKALRINQRWNMFAPYPIKREGWYGFDGMLENGLHVDLWTGQPGYAPTKAPDSLRDWQQDYRWRKYLSYVHQKRYRRQLSNLARYWCSQQWVDANGAVQSLTSIKMTFYARSTQPDWRPDTYKTYFLYDKPCR
ncbi:MAG: HTTM domain-containing protein [Pseudomonadota bacterium]